MKESLLICIACHYSTERMQYLSKVLSEFVNNYDCPIRIIIDTNSIELGMVMANQSMLNTDNIEIFVHENLEHPFHLTWMHRKHIKENIDKYDWVGYFEDDMLLPFENFLNYKENFKLLFPNYIPAFVRIEEVNGKQFVTDAIKRQHLKDIVIAETFFTSLDNPYHALWLMPTKELKETMIDNFVRVHESRETAASYPMWELKKTPLVELENRMINEKCYAYHLANNYAKSKESQFAKIKPKDLFI